MSTEAATEPQQSAPTRIYVRTVDALQTRARAGLRFNKAWATVDIVDDLDNEIAAKQRAGAYVVNVNGLRSILEDANSPQAGLIATTEAPRPSVPVPSPPPPSAAPLPIHWVELAGDLHLAAARTQVGLQGALRSTLEHLRDRATEDEATLIDRFLKIALSSPRVSDEAKRLRHALSDLIPLRSAAGAFGSVDAALDLPRAGSRAFAENTSPPKWMHAAAAAIGEAFPPAHAIHKTQAGFEAARQRYAEALAEARSAPVGFTRQLDHADPYVDIDAGGRAAEQTYEREKAELGVHLQATHASWSDVTNHIRLRVLVSLQEAVSRARSALSRFALVELGRLERDMTTTPALDRNRLWALASTTLLLPPSQDGVASELREDEQVELHVRTKFGIKQRRRAGLVFGEKPIAITVSGSTAAKIRDDDGLVVHVSPEAAAMSASQREALLQRYSEEELTAAAERARAREKAKATRAKDPDLVASARPQSAEAELAKEADKAEAKPSRSSGGKKGGPA